MRKTKLLTFSIFVVCVGILLVSCDTKKKGNESRPQADGVRGEKPGPVEPFAAFEIVAYAKGEKIILDPRSPYFAELQLACKEMLASAEIFAPELKSPPDPDQVKTKEWAVEVAYSKPVIITIPRMVGTALPSVGVRCSRLMIPLTGKLTSLKSASLLEGGGDGYVYLFVFPEELDLPIGTRKSIEKIKATLARFNVKVP